MSAAANATMFLYVRGVVPRPASVSAASLRASLSVALPRCFAAGGNTTRRSDWSSGTSRVLAGHTWMPANGSALRSLFRRPSTSKSASESFTIWVRSSATLRSVGRVSYQKRLPLASL